MSEDLENNPFLNSALQRFTCELYYRFSSFLAPLSVGIITSRHYLSEHNKNGGTSGTSGDNEDEQKLMGSCSFPGLTGPSTSSKCKGPGGPASGVIGFFIGMGMVGFCFGIGLILAVKTVNNLEYCTEELISRK